MKKLSRSSIILIPLITLITFAFGYISSRPVVTEAHFGCKPGEVWKCDTEQRCPRGFDEYGDENKCRKEITTEANPLCPTNYHYQNSGNWNQRCHRNDKNVEPNCWEWRRDKGWKASCDETTSPSGCPSGYTKIGNNCSKTTYQYDDKVSYEDCRCIKPTPTTSPVPTTTVVVTPSVTVTPPEETPTPSENTPTPSEETPVPTSEPSNNNSGDNSSSGSNSAPVCNNSDPGVPGNLRVVALGGGKVRLTWDHSPGTHTNYVVAYGPSIGNYLYGDPNVGDVTTYVVSALNPGGKYCFYVQAQNGCRGGSPSNVVCSNQGAGSLQVLGASTNYNPLVSGIKESYGGQVLGTSTSLVNTAEVSYTSEKLPSGNVLDADHTISIPAINLNQPVYLPQKVGDELTVGSHEVLSTNLNGVQLYYGHNAGDVFGSLFKLHSGEKIIVDRHGLLTEYVVTKIDFVSQDDVSAVTASTPGEIILMTCSYTQPDHRILVKAVPLN